RQRLRSPLQRRSSTTRGEGRVGDPTGRTLGPEPGIEELLVRAGRDEVDFVHLQFTDIMGIVKAVTIPSAELEEALTNGIWFDGSSIEDRKSVVEGRGVGGG